LRLSRRRTARIGFIGLATLATATVVLSATAVDGRSKRANPARAAAFRSCDALVQYARRQAIDTMGSGRLVSPDAMPAAPVFPMPAPATPVREDAAAGVPSAGAVPALPAPASSQPGVDHSPTNVQEAGIDEPDIVKTDGSRIFALDGQKLHAVDAKSNPPRLVGSLSMNGGGDALLLHGDRLLVTTTSHEGGVEARDASYVPLRPKTVLSEVDVSNPAAMRIVRTLRIDGGYVDARLSGGTARVVIGSRPHALDPLPASGPTAVPSPALDEGQRQSVMGAGVGRWLPSYVLRNGRTGRTAKHKLVRCRSVRRARAFSGLDLLTVLTIDLEEGLSPVDSDAVMTDADTVYASAHSMYVATERWLPPDATGQRAPGSATAIHKFDISKPDRTDYRASGEIRGYLLNQFSLSEHKGFLRAASTTRPSWWGGQSQQSESFVTVLDERDGKLAEVGRVGGLGLGERVYSVRFIDDTAYVVTCRQVDPLYTVDLSSPARPRVLGELKILGYSAYLHPVGKHLLIGVGQDATADGWMQGTQISLFDVSDLSNPVRLHQRSLGRRGTMSEVEWDHHAFLYWPPSKLAVLPVRITSGSSSGWQPGFEGAIGFRVGRGGIGEAGRITHESAAGESIGSATPVRRALVLRGKLFTVSARGIEASSLDTLGELARVPFG
jgi:Beta propeller domain